MEIRHLRYFQTLAEELHFGRAAERVDVVQPYFSRQIAALEKELEAQLFARTTRGVTLTPAGDALRQRVAVILPAIDEAAEAARMTAAGGVGLLEVGFIAAAMWSVLPPILDEHRRLFPEMHFRFHELPVAGEELSSLLDGSLDVAFIRPVAKFRALVFSSVLREPLAVVLPENHPRARDSEVKLADLAEERFILTSRTQNPDAYDLFAEACRGAGFSPIVLDEGDTPNVLYLVGVGFGVALAPASAARCNIPGVVVRPLSSPTPEIELVVAHRKSDRSAALKGFLDVVEAVTGN